MLGSGLRDTPMEAGLASLLCHWGPWPGGGQSWSRLHPDTCYQRAPFIITLPAEPAPAMPTLVLGAVLLGLPLLWGALLCMVMV